MQYNTQDRTQNRTSTSTQIQNKKVVNVSFIDETKWSETGVAKTFQKEI